MSGPQGRKHAPSMALRAAPRRCKAGAFGGRAGRKGAAGRKNPELGKKYGGSVVRFPEVGNFRSASGRDDGFFRLGGGGPIAQEGVPDVLLQELVVPGLGEEFIDGAPVDRVGHGL